MWRGDFWGCEEIYGEVRCIVGDEERCGEKMCAVDDEGRCGEMVCCRQVSVVRR